MNIQQYITINNTSKIQIASKGSSRKTIIHSHSIFHGAYLEEIHVDINWTLCPGILQHSVRCCDVKNSHLL